MLEVLVGNVLNSNKKTLVNTVNCVGVMGKGVALLYKEKYPEMFKDYAKRCRHGTVLPGVPYLYQDINGVSIINFPTKDHWRSPSRIEDIANGLDVIVNNYKKWGIESIAFPPLGCGNGGQSWNVVGRIMYQKLSKMDIPIEIYAPFGTPNSELKSDYLNQRILFEDYDPICRINKKLSSDKIAIIEILYKLEKKSHVVPIGRVTFQKICYIGTEVGLKTGIRFDKGYYGPYSSKQLKDLFFTFANSNLIVEKPIGRMIKINTGPVYPELREKYKFQLQELQPKIDKVVDLFSRIKNTEQVEEISTVYYAFKQLKTNKTKNQITEQDLFDYIFEWKKKWINPEKCKKIASAIRNLTSMGWIKVAFSDSLRIDENF
jgi:O-acetyl-ADP-ribose deacetylase (regulator of RNase III)/uncharacterized protein YwgA